MAKLEQQGIIERSNSPWAAPVLVVPKASGDFRPCVDYRALNKVLVPSAYPVPSAQHIPSSLHGAKHITTLDLRGAFWNIWVHQDDRHITGFVTPDGQWQYKRMPMELSAAPSEFQVFIDDILRPLTGRGVFAYMDDVLVCITQSVHEHEQLVLEVLRLLSQNDLRIQPGKCQWVVSQARYLGHEVSASGNHFQP